jgi:hypothetical protein
MDRTLEEIVDPIVYNPSDQCTSISWITHSPLGEKAWLLKFTLLIAVSSVWEAGNEGLTDFSTGGINNWCSK